MKRLSQSFVLKTKQNMDCGLYVEGKFTEARSIFIEVAQGKHENDYFDGISAATSMYCIAHCDLKLGRGNDALQGLESVWAIRNNELGVTHHTIQVQEQISQLLGSDSNSKH